MCIVFTVPLILWIPLYCYLIINSHSILHFYLILCLAPMKWNLLAVDDGFCSTNGEKRPSALISFIVYWAMFLYSTFKQRVKWHSDTREIPSNQNLTAWLLNVGGCVQFFTTIRRLGNKFGNVSSLRAWAPNEARPECSRRVPWAACSLTHISKSVGQ